MKKILIFICLCLCMVSCKEYYSEGERVGTVIQFSETGVFFETWEGQLNLTQTGMNTSGEPFEFSFDRHRKKEQAELVDLVSEAQRNGWKIKINYHEVWGCLNMIGNRGCTDYFVDSVTILDTTFAKPLGNLDKVSETVEIVEAALGTAENPIHIVIDSK